MFGVYLAFVFGFKATPYSTLSDSSLFLCDLSIEGSVCDSSGASSYVTTDNPPTRPSTFYPISNTAWTFSTSNNNNYLGIDSSDSTEVSPKFSGVFYPTKTGLHNFLLYVAHTISSKTCYFSLDEVVAVLEMDLSYSDSGTDYGVSCRSQVASKCSDSTKSYYYYCTRQLYLVSGNAYPFFAGMRYNWTVPQSVNPYLRVTYRVQSGSEKLISSESVAGLDGYYPSATPTASVSAMPTFTPTMTPNSDDTGDEDVLTDVEEEDSSSTASTTKKKQIYYLVGGGVGIVVVAIIGAVIIWLLVASNKKNNDSSGKESSKGKGSSKSNGSGHRGSDKDSKHSKDHKSRSSTRDTSRASTRDTSRATSRDSSRVSTRDTSRASTRGRSRDSSRNVSRSVSRGSERTSSRKSSRK